MKQRLGIAFAILDNPDFIILDAPTFATIPAALIVDSKFPVTPKLTI